jgi:hypothetical protein
VASSNLSRETVAEEQNAKEPTLVDRWLEEQQQWQRTLLTYLDSMAKNEDFLVHLGNAMRGSLLAGKPYPRSEKGAAVPAGPADERLDQILFRLNQIEGHLQDLRLTLDELQSVQKKRSKSKGKKHKDEE